MRQLEDEGKGSWKNGHVIFGVNFSFDFKRKRIDFKVIYNWSDVISKHMKDTMGVFHSRSHPRRSQVIQGGFSIRESLLKRSRHSSHFFTY